MAIRNGKDDCRVAEITQLKFLPRVMLVTYLVLKLDKTGLSFIEKIYFDFFNILIDLQEFGKLTKLNARIIYERITVNQRMMHNETSMNIYHYCSKALISFALLAASGCQQVSSILPSKLTFPGSSSGDCPEKPTESLDSNNVKQISLSAATETFQESPQAIPGQYIGYVFEAKSNQQLSYRPTDDICIWVYAPDTQLLNTKNIIATKNIITKNNLTQDGKYIVQISVPKASSSFSLQMSFGSLETVSSSIPSPTSVPPQSKPSSSESRSESPAASSPVTGLSEKEAVQLVQNSLNAKKRLFAPPYDDELAASLTIGDRYIKTIGGIKWMRDNNAYYQYNKSQVNASNNFSSSSDKAQINVNITEDLVLYVNGQVQQEKSGSETKDYRFYFRLDGNKWKVENVE